MAALGQGGGSLVFITTALLGAAIVSAWLARHYFRLGSWRNAFADWRFRAVALAGTAAILLLGPWRDTFDFGQINIILMGLILADFALYGKARAGEIRWPAGLLIGIAAGIKLTPLAFGLYFLVRRDFKALGWMAAGFFGSIGLAWAMLPTASLTFWTKILPDTGRIGGPAYVDNLSVKGLLLHLGMPDSGLTSMMWLVLSLALAARCRAGDRMGGGRGRELRRRLRHRRADAPDQPGVLVPPLGVDGRGAALHGLRDPPGAVPERTDAPRRVDHRRASRPWPST